MHNVHETAPVVFETRWTLSYLRGPMGREELRAPPALAPASPDPRAATTNGGDPPAVSGRRM